MENANELIPIFGKGELSSESFALAQYDNTYRLAAPRYYRFYAGYIRPRMQMYKGWINGFHNLEYGVLPSYFLQRVGNGIRSLLFAKPIALNTEDPATQEHLAGKTFRRSGMRAAFAEGWGQSIPGGTALIKINRDDRNDLRFEVLPMDRFFAFCDAYGDIERVKCYVATYADTIGAGGSATEYYLCEERFFRYVPEGGERKRYPMVHYTVYKTSADVAAETNPNEEQAIAWKDIPYDIRAMLKRDYGDLPVDGLDSAGMREKYDRARSDGERSVIYDKCKLLPFDDDLGCRMIRFTSSIPQFPTLPFGQPLADLLLNESYQYDQLKFAERVEVYTARARVLIGEELTNPNDPDARKSALDPLVFTFIDDLPAGMNGPKSGMPQVIQPELRAEAIKTQKQNILNDTAFALGLSSSTIAAWLSDGATQKTATEIEYERSRTEEFISEKINLIREPLQDLVDIYFHYYGLTAPELNIVPSEQCASDVIRLYSELYDKGQVTAKQLASRILGTSSVREVSELAAHIEASGQRAQPTAPLPEACDPGTSQT